MGFLGFQSRFNGVRGLQMGVLLEDGRISNIHGRTWIRVWYEGVEQLCRPIFTVISDSNLSASEGTRVNPHHFADWYRHLSEHLMVASSRRKRSSLILS